MKSCLVTGGAGFIGSHLVHGLLAEGYRVRVLDNLSTGHRANLEDVLDRVEFVEGDICDTQTAKQATEGIDVVFHQAAMASVPFSLEYPLESHRACATGTLSMLIAAKDAGVKRFVYAASSSAYGDQPFSSKREIDIPSPLSPYAVAKLAGEYYCQSFFHSFGMETVGLRYFNVYGPRQDPNSPYSAVIPLFVTRLLSGQSPIIYGDGQQSRDFTFVENVVHGNILASKAEGIGGRVINMAEGRQTTLLQLLTLLDHHLGTGIVPKFEPPRAGDVRESLADMTLARQLLGYDSRIGLDEGLARTIDYYRTWRP
ncbi:MAG: SDR family oxidoreductase [Pirellulaceae bacterium]|jgi:UDP-glucose 4-epimerase